jgi:hypothetical protein
MDDPAITPPQPDNGNAWLLWITATVVMPAIAGGVCSLGGLGPLMAAALLIIALFVQLTSAGKLDGCRGCAALLFYLGGWALMMASFFVGCLTNAPRI